jgi:hypothetical protein
MKTYNQQAERVFIPLPRESAAGRQYLHTTTAGGWLPLIQATISGIITGAAVIVLAFVFRARDPWQWAGGAAVITWALTWLQLQRHWFNLTRTGLDLNRDSVTGNQDNHGPEEVRVRLSEVKENGHFQEHIFNLPGDLDQMQTLAEGLTNGQPFSERLWTGAGRPFSVNQFKALRSELIKRGLLSLANSKDPRQGYNLTRVGLAFMRGFIQEQND